MAEQVTPFTVLRDQAYGAFDREPESLLAGFGEPGPGDATLFVMRMMGFDDQVIGEVMSTTYRPVWHQPLMRQVNAADMLADSAPRDIKPDDTPIVDWRPLAWFADARLHAEAVDRSDLPASSVDPATFQARIRFLLYRREPV